MRTVVRLFLVCIVFSLAMIADVNAVIITVTNNADSGSGTLRQAVQWANAIPDTDTIRFNLPAGGRRIMISSRLPDVAEAVVIDGTSQPGYTKSPVIALEDAGGVVTGLVLSAESTVRGIEVSSFERGIAVLTSNCNIRSCYFLNNSYAGVTTESGRNSIDRNYFGDNDMALCIFGIADHTGGGNMVYGNSIGVHPLSGAPHPNRVGIFVSSNNNLIGGTGKSEGNLISGNTGSGIHIGWTSISNSIRGNLIGTDKRGLNAVPNGVGINIEGKDNIVGGIKSGSRNVVSGNTGTGIKMVSYGSGTARIERNRIVGNYIGVDITGTVALGNEYGIEMRGSFCSSNTVGSAISLGRNVISGNTWSGVKLSSANCNNIEGNYIGTDVTGDKPLGNGGAGIRNEYSYMTEIGGASAGARNVISANGGVGIHIIGASSKKTEVLGNYVGTDASGRDVLPNNESGINLLNTENVTIGGVVSGAGNLISGNKRYGVEIAGTNSHNMVIQGNYIGVDVSGQSALGNNYGGVYVDNASSNLIGSVASLGKNVISGNGGGGIKITSSKATGNRIVGNYIGSAADGIDVVPNAGRGIEITHADRCVIGGSIISGGNFIVGNGHWGVRLWDANNCGVTGNRILRNEDGGIYMGGVSTNNMVGGVGVLDSNVIQGNVGPGVHVYGENCVGNNIDYNLISENAGMGIDLGPEGHTPNDPGIYGDPDTGANNLQNHPYIDNVSLSGGNVRIRGHLISTANKAFTMNFYASTQLDPCGYGEGEVVLGRVAGSTDMLSQWNFDVAFPQVSPMPDYITATATRTDTGDTSEFSHFEIVDTDGDGMPDGYETDNFGDPVAGDPHEDPDGDGIDNLEEFLGDTGPHNSLSFLSIIRIVALKRLMTGDSIAAVVFPSSARRVYRIYDNRDMPANHWTGVGGYSMGTGTNMMLFGVASNDVKSVLYKVEAKLP